MNASGDHDDRDERLRYSLRLLLDPGGGLRSLLSDRGRVAVAIAVLLMLLGSLLATWVNSSSGATNGDRDHDLRQRMATR